MTLHRVDEIFALPGHRRVQEEEAQTQQAVVHDQQNADEDDELEVVAHIGRNLLFVPTVPVLGRLHARDLQFHLSHGPTKEADEHEDWRHDRQHRVPVVHAVLQRQRQHVYLAKVQGEAADEGGQHALSLELELGLRQARKSSATEQQQHQEGIHEPRNDPGDHRESPGRDILPEHLPGERDPGDAHEAAQEHDEHDGFLHHREVMLHVPHGDHRHTQQPQQDCFQGVALLTLSQPQLENLIHLLPLPPRRWIHDVRCHFKQVPIVRFTAPTTNQLVQLLANGKIIYFQKHTLFPLALLLFSCQKNNVYPPNIADDFIQFLCLCQAKTYVLWCFIDDVFHSRI